MSAFKILLIMIFLITSGCSGNEDKTAKEQPKNDHVWKTQTDALEKAKKTEQLIMDSVEQKKRKIDEQSN
jgi:hypothetical protein